MSRVLGGRALAVLRPDPGNAATAGRIEAAGHRAIRLPLFAVRALEWTVPDPTLHDALIVTSANTMRHGGAGLASLSGLPVLAVGAATAAAARAAGFRVLLAGEGDAAQLLMLASELGISRALHLGGRERRMPPNAIITATIAVYASEALDVSPAQLGRLQGTVILLHSARAARRLGTLIPQRASLRIATLSQAVADAAGAGWDAVSVAARPDDEALIAAAIALAD